MLKNLLKNKKFNTIIEESLKKENILDIIIFGSSVKGKEEPKDIDLLILYSLKEDKDYTYELRKKLEKEGFGVHIIGSTYNGLFKSNFLARESILSEGYSFKLNRTLSRGFGFSSFILFRYYLNGMNNSKRMKFYYSLYGRSGEKGVLKSFDSYKFSEGIIITPVEQSENLKDFFIKKEIKFETINILLPERIARKEFLERR